MRPTRVLILNATAAPPKPVGAWQRLLLNFKPTIRHETMEGRDYMVVPMVMMTEGVHEGSGGPLLYSAEELGKIPEIWNHKPIVLGHPMKDGSATSACDPDVLTNRKMGVIMGASFSGNKLKAEAWLEKSRVKAVDERVLERLEKGEMIEVSIGVFTDNILQEGGWNGEHYVALATNYKPDHLAILPDGVGACSIKDGAGLLRLNEVSYAQVMELLQTALKEGQTDAYPSYCYVEDAFKGFFVYRKDSKLHKQSYTATDTKATLVGEPVEVVKVVQYRLADGTVVANFQEEVKSVNKTKLIASILANADGGWTEADRPWLEKQSEDRLTMLAGNPFKKKKDEEDEDEEDMKKKKPKANEAAPVLVANTETKTPAQPEREPTPEEYIAKAPVAIRDMLNNGLRVHEEQKGKLIATITANTRNRFTKEQLAAKSLGELQAIAELAAPLVSATAAPSYIGLGGDAQGYQVNQASTKEEALGLPTYEGAKK